MLDAQNRELRTQERKDQRPIEGKKINPQLQCQPHPPKHRLKPEHLSRQSSEIDTFRTILTKRDRHKESQSKLQHRPVRRNIDESKEDRLNAKKQSSKSRSRSKGLQKSKSMKQLGKKSKSMARLEVKREPPREDRKSESPPFHFKSTTSHGERKHLKSHYNSRTTRELVSELTTDRDRVKPKAPKFNKKPKIDILKKPVPAPKSKKKSEKQNLKIESRSKPKRSKKQKWVLVSEKQSKPKRQCQQGQCSFNEQEPLDPRFRPKSKQKHLNIVQIPHRKERLSLNANHPRKPSIKHKTQAQIQHYHTNRQQIQHHAAKTIQRVFRGYLTRKYIKECFEHNAAIKIQKVWRGYAVRKYNRKKSQRFSPMKSKRTKILEEEEYLLQGSAERSELKNVISERWASILEEILSEESVSSSIKKKIENFLQSQQKQLHEIDPLQSCRSPSNRSSISSQIIHNEIASQRHFIEGLRKQKLQPLFLSPKQFISPQHLHNSPQSHFNSPQSLVRPFHHRSSTQLLIANLKNIQKVHRARLQSKAIIDKEQLNKMLIKNKLSPRTHEKMYKQVDMMLESQLEKFNQSINQIVKNCMVYGEPQEEEQMLTTPKKQLTPLEGPLDLSPTHQVMPREEISQQFSQYYQLQKQMADKKVLDEPKQLDYMSFDTSYQFIEQYLISLIDYVRQYDGGSQVMLVIQSIHKSKSHEMNVIFHNSNLMTEGSQDQCQNSFRLPVYKYMDLDESIFQWHIVQQFNQTFPKIQCGKGELSELQEHFIKMVVQAMNQALNGLRPRVFPFAESRLNSLNVLKGLQKIPFECQSSQQQMQYQYICAQALNKIFYWNRLQWGRIIHQDVDQDNYRETVLFLQKQLENSIVQLYSQQEWNFQQELVEMVGHLSTELFETIIIEELGYVWSTIFQWVEKIELEQIPTQKRKNQLYLP